MLKKAFLLGSFLWLVLPLRSQQCSYPGQTPVTAILVCGSSSITVNTPTFCGNTLLPIPCGDGFPYQNVNPNFFRMLCYSAGTLGFSILPSDLSADYNWALFDVTSTNPVDIFTNSNLLVAWNWSSNGGETGASMDGTRLNVCSGAQPLFCSMPDLIQGHTYMLMICNQGGSFGSYQLTFDGGTASITDVVEPHLLQAGLNCDGTKVWVRMNRALVCATFSGTEFTISGGASISSAYTGGCFPIVGSDSVYLVLSQPLSNGNYTVTIDNGSDGNTLIDICGREIPQLETLNFTVTDLQPTLMDSIKPVGCSAAFIELVFKKNILCSSIAADGSDFSFTGPQPITGTFVPGICSTGPLNGVIRLKLNPSTIIPGDYQIHLQTGSDGNTIKDECGLPTPAGATLSFNIKEYVSALFTYDIPPTCRESTASFFHDGAHNATTWNWDFGNGTSSTDQNPIQIFTKPGNYKVSLLVSNGICSDTSSQTIVAGGFLTASFEAPKMICPGDSLRFVNNSTGNIDSWHWSLGNGNSTTVKTPVGYTYAEIGRETYYTVRLVAKNSAFNCGDTTSRVIKALSNCLIAVPTAFTPNGDGKNDFLYPLNALKADQLQFRVYNRFGQIVFQTTDWTRKWDGTINGNELPVGIYAWLLTYVHHDTREKVFMKGTSLLLR